MKWIKNSKGKPDAMLTFAFFGFIVTILAIIFSFINTISVGDFSLTLNSVDTALILGFQGSTLGAYVARRNKILARGEKLSEEEGENMS